MTIDLCSLSRQGQPLNRRSVGSRGNVGFSKHRRPRLGKSGTASAQPPEPIRVSSINGRNGAIVLKNSAEWPRWQLSRNKDSTMPSFVNQSCVSTALSDQYFRLTFVCGLFQHYRARRVERHAPRQWQIRAFWPSIADETSAAKKQERGKAERYTLAKTIVHGLLVLMGWPVGVSIPSASLILNGTIRSVVFCCCSLNPSSGLAA